MKDGNRFDASDQWSMVEIQSNVSSAKLASVFSVREIEERGDLVQDMLYDAEYKAEQAEMENEQLVFKLNLFKEQVLFDQIRLKQISPDHDKIQNYSDGIQRVSQLTTSRNKASLDGIIQFRKNLNEMRKKHAAMLQEKRQMLLMELKENQELKKEHVERQMEIQRLQLKLQNFKKENQKFDIEKYERQKEEIRQRECQFVSDYLFTQKVVEFIKLLTNIDSQVQRQDSGNTLLPIKSVNVDSNAKLYIEELKMVLDMREDRQKEIIMRKQSPRNKNQTFDILAIHSPRNLNQMKQHPSMMKLGDLGLFTQSAGTPRSSTQRRGSGRSITPLKRKTTTSIEGLFQINDDIILRQFEKIKKRESKLAQLENLSLDDKNQSILIVQKAIGLEIILSQYENCIFRLDSQNKIYNDMYMQRDRNLKLREQLIIQLHHIKDFNKRITFQALEKKDSEKFNKESHSINHLKMLSNEDREFTIIFEIQRKKQLFTKVNYFLNSFLQQVCYKMKLLVEKGELKQSDEIYQTFDQFDKLYKEVSHINKAQVEQDTHSPQQPQKLLPPSPKLGLRHLPTNQLRKVDSFYNQNSLNYHNQNSLAVAVPVANNSNSNSNNNNISGNRNESPLKQTPSFGNQSTNLRTKLSVKGNRKSSQSITTQDCQIKLQKEQENFIKQKFAKRVRDYLNYSLLFNHLKKIVEVVSKNCSTMKQQVKQLLIKQRDGNFFGSESALDDQDLNPPNNLFIRHQEFMKEYQKFYNVVSKAQLDKRLKQIQHDDNPDQNALKQDSLVNQAFSNVIIVIVNSFLQGNLDTDKDAKNLKDEENLYIDEARQTKKQEILNAQNHQKRLKESQSHKQILTDIQFKMKEFELYNKSLLSLEKDGKMKNNIIYIEKLYLEQFKSGYTDMFEALQNPDYLKFNKTKIENNINKCNQTLNHYYIIERVLSKNLGIEKLVHISDHFDIENAPHIFQKLQNHQKGKTQFMRDLEKLTQKQIGQFNPEMKMNAIDTLRNLLSNAKMKSKTPRNSSSIQSNQYNFKKMNTEKRHNSILPDLNSNQKSLIQQDTLKLKIPLKMQSQIHMISPDSKKRFLDTKDKKTSNLYTLSEVSLQSSNSQSRNPKNNRQGSILIKNEIDVLSHQKLRNFYQNVPKTSRNKQRPKINNELIQPYELDIDEGQEFYPDMQTNNQRIPPYTGYMTVRNRNQIFTRVQACQMARQISSSQLSQREKNRPGKIDQIMQQSGKALSSFRDKIIKGQLNLQ
ncbi:UNKNOWN [Stylonychia lemnae]|uniref:Uncharacterized protein n=1 Tax=Stylonychia lemnae TaxID=5949 RepID=A0A078B701_STYLE|nr:UNKNOWN [Stylonychia lemnae]|eukprot:CDW89082.1 UNKNOWN [Stylonychia lemnae]